MNYIQILLILLLLVVGLLPVQAQTRINTIIPNPKAVALRRVWMVKGHEVEQLVGFGAGSVGDINGDSINDFAVYGDPPGTWRIYLGSRSTLGYESIWTLDHGAAVPRNPVVGDFRSHGNRSIGFTTSRIEAPQGSSYPVYTFNLFDVDSTGLSTEISDSTEPVRRLKDVAAMNMDNEPGDELVVTVRDSIGRPSVLIYRGGSDFSLREPTVIIAHEESVSMLTYQMTVGDIDGDHRPDLILSGSFSSGNKLKIYFSDENSPWSWAERSPDREIDVVNQVLGLNTPFVKTMDLDGDNVLDLTGIVYGGGELGGTYVFLSSSGKSPHSRTYRLDDAEVFLKSGRSLATQFQWGYPNDSLRHHSMLELYTFDGSAPLSLLYSCDANGPNSINDAYYDPNADGLYDYGSYGLANGTVGDVTGDGWDDFLAGVPYWGPYVEQGIAFILAGGPYIPRDSTLLAVRDIPIDSKRDGLSVWPNPVIDELNIAWRGDLQRMPHRFEVHTIAGALIASGTVQPWRGAAVWNCSSVASGTYLLTAFDDKGMVIATTTVVKQ